MIKAGHVRLDSTDAGIFDDDDDAAKRIATQGYRDAVWGRKTRGGQLLLAVSKVKLFLMPPLRRWIVTTLGRIFTSQECC